MNEEAIRRPAPAQQSRGARVARRLFWHALRKPVPFGPMLAVGAILAMLYGARINTAYMNWANPDVRETRLDIEHRNVSDSVKLASRS